MKGMNRISALKVMALDRRGFTLVEMLVGLGILATCVGLVSSGLFQVFSFQTSFQDDVVATKDLRHVGSWFAGDVLKAKAAVDGNGEPLVCGQAATSATLTWSDTSGVAHTSTYRVSGTSLERDLDGAVITLARQVISAGFSLCGKLLTLDLAVEAQPGRTETMSLQTYIRKLE